MIPEERRRLRHVGGRHRAERGGHVLCLRAALGARARGAVLDRYTVAAMQAATLNVYDELLVGVAATAT